MRRGSCKYSQSKSTELNPGRGRGRNIYSFTVIHVKSSQSEPKKLWICTIREALDHPGELTYQLYSTSNKDIKAKQMLPM